VGLERPSLVTGIGGQDGAYLTRVLQAAGRTVVGTFRPGDPQPHYVHEAALVALDVRDTAAFGRLLEQHQPAEVYNLAAFTSVGASWSEPDQVTAVNGDAVVGMLGELVAFRDRHGWTPRFFQASTADQYGVALDVARDETTPMHPQSPYALAKQRAHDAVVRAREADGLFACNGILFNHESPLRPLHFVTRKIARAAAEIALGRRDPLTLGTLDVRRDWGAAADHAEAIRLMLAAERPADYVIATGTSRPLAEVVDLAFAAAGVAEPWRHVRQDPELMRPADVPDLVGDPAKAGRELGWRATTPFEDVVAAMVRVDLRRLETGVEDDPAYLSGA